MTDINLEIGFRPDASGRPQVLVRGHRGDEAPARPFEVPRVIEDVTTKPRRAGARLFDAIFEGKALVAFERAADAVRKARALDPASRPLLRIRLRFDLEDPIGRLCAALPWEILRQSDANDHGDFLALSSDRSIVRHVRVPHATDPPPLRGDLRILAIESDVLHLPRLNLGAERRAIEDAYTKRTEVLIDRLREPSLAKIRERLREGDPHVFHFMGHATLDTSSDIGRIFLGSARDIGGDAEVSVRPSDGTSARRLARTLRGHNLRLAVLNACSTGHETVQPFSSIASALVEAGIPAVVAMSRAIPDQAAIAFSKAFYHCLGREEPLEVAMAEGRLSIEETFSDSTWATPQLYLRSDHGWLLSPRSTTVPVQSEISGNRPGTDPLPLGELTYQGLKQVNDLLIAPRHQRGEFFQKYVSQVYYERPEIHDFFHEFLSQSERRCLVVTGHAGKGKTMLVCHFTRLLADHRDTVPVLLSSGDLRLEREDLKAKIAGSIPRSESGATVASFEHLSAELVRQGGSLLVFVDGINELAGRNAVLDFNRQLADLLDESESLGLDARFIISCRSEVWPSFRSASWTADSIFRRSAVRHEPGASSLELDDFREEEVDTVSQLYFRWYRIRGRLIGSARQACRDPIMLRYLCAAYTRRKPNDKTRPPCEIPWSEIGETRTLRRKKAFDEFVANRRKAMAVAAVQAQSEGSPGAVLDDRYIYQTTTLYIITLAFAMYQKGRTYVTADEAITVAVELDHPDAALAAESKHAFIHSQRSFFFQMINEGIILNRRGPSTFSFTFEAYFEYSLGRFLALVHWPRLEQEEGIDAVLVHFGQLVADHRRLSKESSFHNLFGALQFAILVLEEGDPQQGYPAQRELAIRLIERMSDIKMQGFDWVQQACATIRQTHLAQPETWTDADDEERKNLEWELEQILDVLDRLAATCEFVLMWDLERTLTVLAGAQVDLVLNRLRKWTQGDEVNLRQVFGIQALSRLCTDHAEKAAQLLLEVATGDIYQREFWLARVWVSAARSAFEHRRILSRELQEKLHAATFRLVAEDRHPAIRGVALPALPFMLGTPQSFREVDRLVDELIEQDASPWILLNLVLELRHSLPEKVASWRWALLERLAEVADPHVRYAVADTARQLEGQDRVRSRQLVASLKRNRWRPGIFDAALIPDSRLAVVYSPAYLEPACDNHIECRERLQYVVSLLEASASGLFQWVSPRMAREEELEWAHSQDIDQHRDGSPWPRYVDEVSEAGRGIAEQKTSTSRQAGASELRYESFDAAMLSVGGVLRAVDYVMASPARCAMSLNRPPGHLANNSICVFNNIAIAARYAQDQYGLQRLFVLDFDAHHGHHTYRVFRKDPEVVYCSIHVDGHYAAEAGTAETLGEEEGEGYTFHINYPLEMSDEGYAEIVDDLLLHLIREFRPEMLLLSAGFDGHFHDVFTQGKLTERAYIHLAERLVEVVDELGIKIVGTFEGGYALNGVSRSLVQMLRVLGDWQLDPESIGLNDLPEQSPEVRATALERTRDSIRERVELMKATAEGRADYPFDLEKGPLAKWL